MLSNDDTMRLLKWFATNIGADGTFFCTEDISGARDANLDQLLKSHHEEDLMKAVRECIQTKSSRLVRAISYLDAGIIQKRLGSDRAEFSFEWKSYPGDLRFGLVAISRLKSYPMLMKEHEYIKYMCETVGKGLGIFELDPSSGKSWLLFGTEEYSRLCTASIEELKLHGIPSVGRHVPEEDRRRAAKYMHQSMCSLTSWTIAPRVFRDGAYRFTRFAGHCTSGDKGTVLSSVIAEDFSDHAREIEKSNVEKSASCILRSFLSAVFDVSFYIDNDYRILDDSTKLEHFLGSKPKGLLFHELLLKVDQARFSQFMTSQRNQQPDNIASMIRLRLWTQRGNLIDVELFSSPNFVQSNAGLDFTSNVSTMCSSDAGGFTDDRPTEFLIGLRVLSDVAKNTPKLHDEISCYRSQLSDIRNALESPQSYDGWIVPVSLRVRKEDATEIEECALRRLPAHLQKLFRACVSNRDFLGCRRLLEESQVNLEGPVPQFLLHFAQSLPVKDAREIISMFEYTPSYSDPYFLFDLCQFALSLGITDDQTDGEYVECMRRIFVQSLRAANSREDLPEVQVIMYHICILWGCINKRLGRINEASVALELVVDELKSYLIYYPECTIGKRLDHIARHNLGCELLRDTDILDAIRVSLHLHSETEKRSDYLAGFLSN